MKELELTDNWFSSTPTFYLPSVTYEVSPGQVVRLVKS